MILAIPFILLSCESRMVAWAFFLPCTNKQDERMFSCGSERHTPDIMKPVTGLPISLSLFYWFLRY